MPDLNLQTELRKQLGFLQRSAKAYDEGHIEEAIRIATTIRVLFHDTGSSISLLSHLGAKTVMLKTSVDPKFNVDSYQAYWGGLTEVTVEMNKPALGTGVPTHWAKAYPGGITQAKWELSAEQWWNECIYLFQDDVTVTRKQLTLAAANKDGGAHVDKNLELPKEYLRLHAGDVVIEPPISFEGGGALFSITCLMGAPVKIEGEQVSNFHYSDLRQMATEILGSPELMALCNE